MRIGEFCRNAMSYIGPIELQAAEGTRENASWCDRPASALTIYAYVNNDPLNLTDPFGLTADGGNGGFSNYLNGSLSALGQIPRDIGSLLSNPSSIPGALASALPGLAPAAGELPQTVSTAIGAIRAFGTAETPPFSTYDTSNTSPGSQYLNVETNVTAQDFQANLMSNGYSIVRQTTSTNGPVTILSNGTSTYTLYTRTSTGLSGAQFFGPNGGSIKFSLGVP